MGDLGKLIVAKALKSCPKFNKSPNLVTLLDTPYQTFGSRGAFAYQYFYRAGLLHKSLRIQKLWIVNNGQILPPKFYHKLVKFCR